MGIGKDFSQQKEKAKSTNPQGIDDSLLLSSSSLSLSSEDDDEDGGQNTGLFTQGYSHRATAMVRASQLTCMMMHKRRKGHKESMLLMSLT